MFKVGDFLTCYGHDQWPHYHYHPCFILCFTSLTYLLFIRTGNFILLVFALEQIICVPKTTSSLSLQCFKTHVFIYSYILTPIHCLQSCGEQQGFTKGFRANSVPSPNFLPLKHQQHDSSVLVSTHQKQSSWCLAHPRIANHIHTRLDTKTPYRLAYPSHR